MNKLDPEARDGRQGKLANLPCRLDLVALDELGHPPFAQTGGQLLFHLLSPLREQTSVIVTTNLATGRMAKRLRRRQDDHRAARPAHPFGLEASPRRFVASRTGSNCEIAETGNESRRLKNRARPSPIRNAQAPSPSASGSKALRAGSARPPKGPPPPADQGPRSHAV